MITITTGWVFIHPNGKVTTEYLHSADFDRSCWPNTPARQLEIMQKIQRDYFHSCELMRVRIIPFEDEQ